VSNDFHRTVIITVVAVGMVQVTVDEIVHMVAMRDRFVTAARSMNVSSIMSGAAMVGRATIRILVAHFNPMFVHMIGVRMVKMAIVEIIHVVAVPDRKMAAAGSMRVVVVGMMRKIAGGHFDVLSLSQRRSPACATAFSTSLNTWSSVDRVDRVLALAPTLDQTGLQQDLQARRNRADLVAFSLGEFANIPFPRS
jgi:hypothetical protein